MSHQIRAFNNVGLERVDNFLRTLKKSLKGPYWNSEVKKEIDNILFDEDLTNLFSESKIERERNFSRRYEFGSYLFKKIGNIHIEREVGLLTWLALFYFEQIVEINGESKKMILRKHYAYIPERTGFRFSRHRILAPYLTYQKMGEDSIILLTNPPYQGGDAVEQWVTSQEFIGNNKVIKVGRKLYFDENEESLKTGAFSEGKKGGARRFVRKFVKQFSKNYDLYECSIEQIIDLLPDEYITIKSIKQLIRENHIQIEIASYYPHK